MVTVNEMETFRLMLRDLGLAFLAAAALAAAANLALTALRGRAAGRGAGRGRDPRGAITRVGWITSAVGGWMLLAWGVWSAILAS